MEEKKIPEAKFIENVPQFCKGKNVDTLLSELQDQYSRLKLFEAKIIQQIDSMTSKIPQYEKNMEIMKSLEKLEDDTVLDFMIADTFWTKAMISKDVKTVCLWLGANTLVEYAIPEARQLINKNLNNARDNLKDLGNDLQLIKDQITVTEVNVARVHNFNVVQKQKK